MFTTIYILVPHTLSTVPLSVRRAHRHSATDSTPRQVQRQGRGGHKACVSLRSSLPAPDKRPSKTHHPPTAPPFRAGGVREVWRCVSAVTRCGTDETFSARNCDLAGPCRTPMALRRVAHIPLMGAQGHAVCSCLTSSEPSLCLIDRQGQPVTNGV